MHVYEYSFQQSGEYVWNFEPVRLDKINLLVGASGSGKTRFLNTFFNLGRLAAGSMTPGSDGIWNVTVSDENIFYKWFLETKKEQGLNGYVAEELLTMEVNGDWKEIVRRERDKVYYLGEELPKLNNSQCSISIFRDNEEIKPLHKGFSKVMRRYFSGDELVKATRAEIVSPTSNLLSKDIDEIYTLELGINTICYYLSKSHPNLFDTIRDYFTSVFPFIKKLDIKDYTTINPGVRTNGKMPLLCIKEKGIQSWLPIDSLSSGMQKVLLIITDIITLPKNSIYIIDEYENSLGVNAINFFYDFISENQKNIQFLVSSHHPYIINSIPPENWFIFSRQGSEVSIRYGEENKAYFSRSKQQRFIQLINDPYYQMSNQ